MTKIAPSDKMPTKTESPSRHFDEPKQIVKDETLTKGQKKKALAAWQDDAEALQRAEDEGMGGGEPSKLIDVVAAKKTLETKR